MTRMVGVSGLATETPALLKAGHPNPEIRIRVVDQQRFLERFHRLAPKLDIVALGQQIGEADARLVVEAIVSDAVSKFVEPLGGRGDRIGRQLLPGV